MLGIFWSSFPYNRPQRYERPRNILSHYVSGLIQLFTQPFLNLYRRVFLSRLLQSAELKYPRIPRGGAKVRRLTSTTVLKRCEASQLRCELEAMRLVYSKTTIPLPRVHDYWERGLEGFLVMDFVDGENLKRAWYGLTQAQQTCVLRKLGDYVHQLRQVSQPACRLGRSGWVGSAQGGPVWDVVLCADDEPFGPFSSQRVFNDWRVTKYDRYGKMHPPTATHVASLRRAMPDDHRIVFSHGDIHRDNVFVKIDGEGPEDVRIVALLDWGQSGWRPEYWEGFKVAWLNHDKANMWPTFARQELAFGVEDCIDREFELMLVAGGIPP